MCNMLPGSGIATAKAVEAVMSRPKECIVDVAVATEVCSFFFFRVMFLSCRGRPEETQLVSEASEWQWLNE